MEVFSFSSVICWIYHRHLWKYGAAAWAAIYLLSDFSSIMHSGIFIRNWLNRKPISFQSRKTNSENVKPSETMQKSTSNYEGWANRSEWHWSHQVSRQQNIGNNWIRISACHLRMYSRWSGDFTLLSMSNNTCVVSLPLFILLTLYEFTLFYILSRTLENNGTETSNCDRELTVG